MTRLRELIRGEAKHTLSMPRWLERLASIGIVTANPEITRRQRITNIGAFVAAGTTLGHLVFNAVHDASGLIIIHVFNGVFALLALLIPSLHRLHAEATFGDDATVLTSVGKTKKNEKEFKFLKNNPIQSRLLEQRQRTNLGRRQNVGSGNRDQKG